MTLTQALQQSTCVLSKSGIEDSRIEARILLGHATNLSPVQICTEPQKTLSPEEVDRLQRLIKRRLQHEPTAYIISQREFYGIDFYVDRRVLIPRPETEILVDTVLKTARTRVCYPQRPLTIADIGTGCGAIAVSLALNLPAVKVYATDISPYALQVAALNCRRHQVDGQVILLQGNLLQPLPEPVDLIVANLPYVRKSELPDLSPEIVEFEPRIALDGGESGLERIKQLLEQAREKINAGGCLLLEIGQNQETYVGRLIHRYLNGLNFRFITDLNCIKRVVKIDL